METKRFFHSAAGLLFALALTISCSSDENGNEPSSSSGTDLSSSSNGGEDGISEGRIYTYGIEGITESLFITLDESCFSISPKIISYSINNKVLSLGGVEFNGNSDFLIGTWTREPFSAVCEDDDDCNDYNKISKAVFTQNSLTYTSCIGRIGEYEDDDGEITKIIDCGTLESTRGTETGIVKYSGTEISLTYNGKTCKLPMQYSVSEIRKACTEAHDKAEAEGNNDRHTIEVYYSEILNKDIIKCHEDNNFPQWFH
jgi:hypothetical protein